MTFARQSLATEVAYDTIADAFIPLVQAAGLRPGIIDICKSDAATPSELRHSLVRQLQATLPTTVPLSVRARASAQMTGPDFSTHEQRVVSAVIAQAHASPTLRPVVTRDRAGRESTEFFGAKASWMNQFKTAPQIMARLGAVEYPV